MKMPVRCPGKTLSGLQCKRYVDSKTQCCRDHKSSFKNFIRDIQYSLDSFLEFDDIEPTWKKIRSKKNPTFSDVLELLQVLYDHLEDEINMVTEVTCRYPQIYKRWKALDVHDEIADCEELMQEKL